MHRPAPGMMSRLTVGKRVKPRSAGAHYEPPEPTWPTLTARMLIGAALAAVLVILGAAWFLTAFPVPS